MYPSRPAPPPPKTTCLPEGHPFTMQAQKGYFTPARLTSSFAHSLRPGPASPSASGHGLSAIYQGNPPNRHPFAPYYTFQHANSTSSFSTSTPSSPACPSSPSSVRRQSSPISAPAALLSPRPPMSSFGTRSYTTPYPSSLTHKSTSSPLPTDLALFDARPRQNLLGDLETILGKKLTFPLIEKMSKRKEKISKEKRVGRTLKKERDHSWEERFAWEGVQLLNEKKVSRRGVKEGNWI